MEAMGGPKRWAKIAQVGKGLVMLRKESAIARIWTGGTTGGVAASLVGMSGADELPPKLGAG
jgi:hypothetical protein